MLLGIEIGGTKLQLVLAAGPGAIVRRWRGDVDRRLGGKGICRQIEGAAEALLAGDRAALAAVGVGFGGPIDARSGTVCRSHQIEGWEGFGLKQWLRQLLGVAVAVDNDANAAALGEAVHGAGRGFDPVFFSTLGSGVGGGMVAGGKVYHGQPPGEAEWGHLLLDRQGATVESRCSGWAVDGRIRELCKAEPGSLLARLTAGASGGEARFLAQAIAEHDAPAIGLLESVAGDMAFGLSHVTHLFHPQVMVLGGGLSLVGEPLRLAVAQALPRFVMRAFWPPPEIRLAGLGEDSVTVGALELARREAEAGLRS